jgi:hypothetical protein
VDEGLSDRLSATAGSEEKPPGIERAIEERRSHPIRMPE